MQKSAIENKYLQNQNKQLRVQLEQMKQLVDMHKQALTFLSGDNIKPNKVINILLDIIRGKSSVKRDQVLLKRIIDLQSKLLVLQKITDQAYISEKQTYRFLVDEFKQIKDDNLKKDQKLNSFYQKIGEVDYLSGLVTKYIEVLTPTQQALAFIKQQNQLLDIIALQKQTTKKIEEQKQNLIKINVHMKEQLQRRKQDIRNMTLLINSPEQTNNINFRANSNILDDLQQAEKFEDQPSEIKKIQLYSNNDINGSLNNQNLSLMNASINGVNASSLNNTINFIRLQNQLIKQQKGQTDSDNDMDDIIDCPELYTLFPDKIHKINESRHKKRVPYLNMSKVRQLMARRQSKITKQMGDGANVNPTQKIIRLQNELDITRKQLTKIMLKYRTIQQQYEKITAHMDQVQNRNIILIEANERLSNFYKQINQSNQKYRKTILKIENLTGRKIIGINEEEEISNILRLSTRRNTTQQFLLSILKNKSTYIRKSQSL